MDVFGAAPRDAFTLFFLSHGLDGVELSWWHGATTFTAEDSMTLMTTTMDLQDSMDNIDQVLGSMERTVAAYDDGTDGDLTTPDDENDDGDARGKVDWRHGGARADGNGVGVEVLFCQSARWGTKMHSLQMHSFLSLPFLNYKILDLQNYSCTRKLTTTQSIAFELDLLLFWDCLFIF